MKLAVVKRREWLLVLHPVRLRQSSVRQSVFILIDHDNGKQKENRNSEKATTSDKPILQQTYSIPGPLI